MNPDFYLFFNKKRQWASVHLWDVHQNTFANWDSGRWGYWEATWSNPRSGLFGEFHFLKGRLRIDTISHELDHLRQEWIWANRLSWTGGSEEALIEMKDKLLGSFLRELAKVEPKTKVWFLSLENL